MMSPKEQIEFLRAHSSPSKWKEKAEFRRANHNRLMHSRKTAIKNAIALNRKENK